MQKKYHNVSLHQGPFEGFGTTHNKASSLAKHDWILSIDSDEIVTPDLCGEIQNLSLNPKCVYSLSRKNYYNGKWIKWCGWHPDYQYKLYHRKETNFNNAQVHEAIITSHMETVPLQSPLIHFPYESTSDFLNKMQTYSHLFAIQHQGKKKASLFKAISRGLFSFFKSYVLKRGFLGGSEGFIISVYNGNTAFYKYLKLHEWNKK